MKPRHFSLYFVLALAGLLGACGKPENQQSRSAPGATSTAANSAGGVLLKVQWPVGNKYTYRMDLEQHSTNRIPQIPQPIPQDVTMAMTYSLTVLQEPSDAGRKIELEFLANEMEVIMGGQTLISFDSKEAGQAKNPMTVPLMKMIGSKVRLVVDGTGKVQKLEGFDEWTSTVFGAGTDPGAQMLTQHFNEGFFRQLADFGRSLSDRPVAVGQTWPMTVQFPMGSGKIAVDSKVTLKGWEERDQHRCAILDSKGTLSGTLGDQGGPMGKMSIDRGKLSATSWFDSELGTMIETDSAQSMRIKGEMAGQAGDGKNAGFTSELSQKITVKQVEVTKSNG